MNTVNNTKNKIEIRHMVALTAIVAIIVSAAQVRAAVSTFADGLVVGGTSLTSGLLLEVEGRIGATELCNESGGECSDVSDIYTTVLGGGGGGGGISGSGSANYLPKFTAATTLGNSLIQESGSFVGIGRVPSFNLDVNGNIAARSGNLYLGSGAAQSLYGDNSSALYWDSNHSTVTQLIFRDAENSIYGRVYGDGDTANFGLLDRDGNWSLRILNDSQTIFYVNDAPYFAIGPNGVTGNYGTVQVNSGGKGGWEGYNINGRAAFMHDGSGSTGIYDDVNNEWLFYAVHNAHTYMYYNGTWRFRTESNGARTNGNHRADAYCDANGNNCRAGAAQPLFTKNCTNEQSDGDGYADRAGCVAAAQNNGTGNGVWEAFSCTYGSNAYRVGFLRFVSGTWQFHSGGWYPCTDGSVDVINLNATF